MRLALYQPEIAQNVGAAIRLCACFDVTLDIIEPCGFPLKQKELRRTAMDYGSMIDPIYHSSWDSFVTSPVRQNNRLILLSTKAQTAIYDFSFHPSDTLLIGQESTGAPEEVWQECDEAALIPLSKGARSLNMAVAAGIGLSEAIRQTKYQK